MVSGKYVRLSRRSLGVIRDCKTPPSSVWSFRGYGVSYGSYDI